MIPLQTSRNMSIDQIIRILLASLVVDRRTKALGETDRARVVRIDVTHQRFQFAILKGPIAQSHSSLERVPFAFGLGCQLPTKFWFRKKWALVDLNLPQALFGLAKLN